MKTSVRYDSGHSRRAFLLLEALVSVALLLLLISTLAWVLTEYSAHTQILRTRMRAAAVAESVLNEIRAGVPAPQDVSGERFKGFVVDVIRKPGEGDWLGLTLVVVRVHASTAGEHPPPLGELAGYVAEARQ